MGNVQIMKNKQKKPTICQPIRTHPTLKFKQQEKLKTELYPALHRITPDIYKFIILLQSYYNSVLN